MMDRRNADGTSYQLKGGITMEKILSFFSRKIVTKLTATVTPLSFIF